MATKPDASAELKPLPIEKEVEEEYEVRDGEKKRASELEGRVWENPNAAHRSRPSGASPARAMPWRSYFSVPMAVGPPALRFPGVDGMEV